LKQFKTLVALVLAMVMTLSLVGAAFAEDDPPATSTLPKANVSITGLETGDGVTLYKVIKWDTTTSNWAFDGIAVASPYDTVDALIAALGGENAPAAMTALTDAIASTSKATENSVSSLEGTTYTYNAEVGMYLALVTTNTANAYNPMVLSVNYDLTANPATATGAELAATTATGSTTLAKKQPITLDKEVTGEDKKQDIAAGDTIPYTVTTVTPNYGTNYKDPYFVLTDTLSTGLELTQEQQAAITVKNGAGAALNKKTDADDTEYDYEITTSADGYVITFSKTYLNTIKANTGITVEYTATVTKDANFHQVDEFENTVTAEFSNKPTGEHGSLTDDTHHYTFSIDAELFGNQSGDNITKELKKIAQAFDGSPITQWETTETSWTTDVTPLQGAEFTLTGNGHTYNATSGTDGRLTFVGLDAGDYTLTEISAPAGYKFSTADIPVSISASYNTDGTLKDYTITVNNSISTKYSTTISGDHISTVTIDETIKNTAGIKNEPGATLPSTGGIGTTIFYVAGIVLVLGAAAIIIARRKAEQN